MNVLTDVEQDTRSLKNLVIDVLREYVEIHVVLEGDVVGKDDWGSGEFRQHDARDFREGTVNGRAG